MNNKRGALIYAFNNKKINYFSIANTNALLIKHHLGIPVCIVTDEESAMSVEKHYAESVIITEENASENPETRFYRNAGSGSERLVFHNKLRYSAYDISPFDETLLIDADYLIMSNILSQAFGSQYDVLINADVTETIVDSPESESHITPFGIRLYWATVVYFKKTPFSKSLFELVKYVKENYTFYTQMYGLPSGVYRNDYAFSIALHLLNDSQQITSPWVSNIPGGTILKSYSKDEIYSIPDRDTMLLVTKDHKDNKRMMAKIVGRDVHVMNKFSLQSHLVTLEELYDGN